MLSLFMTNSLDVRLGASDKIEKKTNLLTTRINDTVVIYMFSWL